MAEQPIFIHSLFRAGSTYLYSCFRDANNKYWCYQEPLHEILVEASYNPEVLRTIHGNAVEHLRHPRLEVSYFHELYEARDVVSKCFQKSFPYDQYFFVDEEQWNDLANYFLGLIEVARARPLFQCCRTTGRVPILKDICGGVHLFLYRNPWDQWWSYRIGFDQYTAMVLNNKNLPPFLKSIKKEIGLEECHDSDIRTELAHFHRHELRPEESYVAFYALWCHAILETSKHCDFSISIDQLSQSTEYNSQIVESLLNHDISEIDLSGCSSPTAIYSQNEIRWFDALERKVHEHLLKCGYNEKDVENIKNCEWCRGVVRTSESETIRQSYDKAVDNAERTRDQLKVIQTRLASEQEAHRRELDAERARDQLKVVQTRLASEQGAHRRELDAERQRSEEVRAELVSVYSSRSWRLTRPLRELKNCCSGTASSSKRGITGLMRALRRILRTLTTGTVAFIRRRPTLHDRISRWLEYCPRLKARLRRLANDASSSSGGAHGKGILGRQLWGRPDTPEYLTEQAARVFSDLKKASHRGQG